MGMNMSAIDAPFGFQPWGPVLRQRLYAVQTAPVIHVYHGDLVLHGGDALATKYGVLPIIIDAAVPDGVANTQKLCGVVLSCFDENMDPIKYIAATRVGDGAIAGYIMVSDHPRQEYLIQEDGTGNAIDLDEVGLACDVISGTICLGNPYTGVSLMQLDSDTAAASAALDVLLHRPHPDDTAAADATPYCRWIVTINTQFENGFSAGA
jgi:hypothetical protein